MLIAKGGCACVGTGRMWELIHSAQICCKPKIAPKKIKLINF